MTAEALQHVEFRGITVNKITRQQLRIVEKDQGAPMVCYQGSYRPVTSYSGRTHHGGMAVDSFASANPVTRIKQGRALKRAGFATWHRPPNWDGKGGIRHFHSILIASPTDADPSALGQIKAYKAGRNGLLSNLLDKTWRPSPIRTVHYAAGPNHFDFTVWNQNAKARGRAGWTRRRDAMAKRILAGQPDVVCFEELYAAYRPGMSRKLTGYRVAGVNSGKVIYTRNATFKPAKLKVWAFHLPHGKDAVGRKIMHVKTGRFVNIVGAHLSYQHSYGAQRTSEVKSLFHQAKVAFPHDPIIFVGDWNDSLERTDSRPADSAGKAFAAYGYADAFKRTHRKYGEDWNSANQFELPPPRHGIHLDRVFVSSKVDVLSWSCYGYTPKDADDYESDHFAVGVQLRVPVG